jgi:hypothetical protein
MPPHRHFVSDVIANGAISNGIANATILVDSADSTNPKGPPSPSTPAFC